jgi:hypothetical protein
MYWGVLAPFLSRAGDLAMPQVDHLRQLALEDHVGGFQVQMQDVVAVEVLDGRAQVYPEVDDVREREAPGADVDQVRERSLGEGLLTHDRARLLQHLVGAYA